MLAITPDPRPGALTVQRHMLSSGYMFDPTIFDPLIFDTAGTLTITPELYGTGTLFDAAFFDPVFFDIGPRILPALVITED